MVTKKAGFPAFLFECLPSEKLEASKAVAVAAAAQNE